jgi:hypothetical protein
MATPDITRFFSPENRLIVFLICASLYSNWSLHTNQTEMQSELKLITYRLNNGDKTENNTNQIAFKPVDKGHIFRCAGKPEFQKTGFPITAYLRDNRNNNKNRYHLFTTTI